MKSILFYSAICSLIWSVQSQLNDSSAHWDLLLYTQRYPLTVCMEWKEKNQSHTCSLPSPDNAVWTVHGIWPTRLGSIGPEFCNRTWHFDPEQIKPIETKLLEKWINVEKDTLEYSFWAHEWNKHGTCASIIEPLNSQIKYFTQGLNWLNKYSMSDILSRAGIVPSDDNSYLLYKIHNAIKQELKVNPVIECRREDKRNYLFELRICFDQDLNLKDCDGVIGYSEMLFKGNKIITNCQSMGILYPKRLKQQSLLPIVQLYKFVNWLQWMTW